jgi:hypothetical protein
MSSTGSASVQLPSGRDVVALACDESGYEGENLIGSMTDVFAHASVRLAEDVAAFCVAELRDRIGSPALEYKAGHLLRRKSRPTLLWFLGKFGPLRGNAHVYLVDKAFYVVRSLVEIIIGDRAAADPLYRDGRDVFGDELWGFFLESANAFVRVKESSDAVGSLYDVLDVMRYAPDAPAVVDRLWQERVAAESYRSRIAESPPVFPMLDALFPATLAAVDFWSGESAAVTIKHDRQNSFSQRRIAELTARSEGRLVDFRLVDSYADARVQVADFLAGVARQIATWALWREDRDELSELLRPYVDEASIWADERSWSRIAHAASRT